MNENLHLVDQAPQAIHGLLSIKVIELEYARMLEIELKITIPMVSWAETPAAAALNAILRLAISHYSVCFETQHQRRCDCFLSLCHC